MRRAVVLAALAIGLAAPIARAQVPLSAEAREAILAYPLTLPRANHLIAAMDATTKYLVSLPDYRERLLKSMKLTPAERAAQLEQDPKTAAILKQNDLTGRDYIVGV